MKGMRKNVWSEYKKVGLGDFVPKLGVALLAALIILSLAGCKNAVGGGVGSSGGGAGAGAGAGGSGNRAMYTFKDKDGSPLGTTMLSGERSFGMIKSKVADVPVVESAASFLGWVVDGDTTLIKDENKYSSTTTFVATYDAAAKLNTYNFYDGSTLLTPNGIRVRGETTLAEVLALAGNDINIGVTNFIGWKSADGKIIPTGQKLNESTNFYASYNLRLQSFDVQVDIMDYLWLHIDSNKYTYFDTTGVFTIDASPSAKSSIQKYKNAVEMMYSTKTSDPSYSLYYNEKLKYENYLTSGGFCWPGQDAAGFSTFEVWTTGPVSLYLSLSGKELLDANDKVVYKRID